MTLIPLLLLSHLPDNPISILQSDQYPHIGIEQVRLSEAVSAPESGSPLNAQLIPYWDLDVRFLSQMREAWTKREGQVYTLDRTGSFPSFVPHPQARGSSYIRVLQDGISDPTPDGVAPHDVYPTMKFFLRKECTVDQIEDIRFFRTIHEHVNVAILTFVTSCNRPEDVPYLSLVFERRVF